MEVEEKGSVVSVSVFPEKGLVVWEGEGIPVSGREASPEEERAVPAAEEASLEEVQAFPKAEEASPAAEEEAFHQGA